MEMICMHAVVVWSLDEEGFVDEVYGKRASASENWETPPVARDMCVGYRLNSRNCIRDLG